MPGYIALAVAAVAEGTSLARAAWQARAQARGRGVPFIEHVWPGCGGVRCRGLRR